MPVWKQFLLAIYYHTTCPYRWQRFRTLSAAGRAPVAVLTFHRVADDRANAWTTSTATFVNAIAWLKRHFELISLEEAQRRIRSGRNCRPCVSLTFDDGYAVNCRQALPLIVQEGIPLTYFVTTQPVLEGVPFEHDLRMGNRFAPNTIEDLRELARQGIEIGAHTRTHADLGRMVDPDDLHDELVASRDELQAAVGRPVRYFAFPFGRHENLSARAIHLAKESGFAGVCSAYGGYNHPGDDAFHLQRCGVDGALIRLKNWSTIDPLRNRHIPRFQYGHAEPRREQKLAEVGT